MTTGSLLTFILVMIGVNVSPGPGMAAIVGATISGGVRSGIAVFAGSLLGDYVYFLAAIAGAGALALALGAWLKILTFVAGVYLLWVGTAPFRARAPAARVEGTDSKPLNAHAGFASGLFITLGNPGVIFFFLALLPAVTNLENLKLSDIAVMSLVLVGVSCAVFAIIILIAAATRRHVLVGIRGDWAERASGIVLALAGVWLIWDAGATLAGHLK